MAKKRGRKPLSFTDKMQEKFLRAIRLGCPIRDACGCAGVSESAYYRWVNEGEEGLQTPRAKVMREFKEKLKRAEGEATQAWLAVIERAAQEGTWQAAAWKLERRRSMFVPKIRQEVTGHDGEAIKVQTEARSARELIEAAISRSNGLSGEGEGSGEPDPGTAH